MTGFPTPTERSSRSSRLSVTFNGRWDDTRFTPTCRPRSPAGFAATVTTVTIGMGIVETDPHR